MRFDLVIKGYGALVSVSDVLFALVGVAAFLASALPRFIQSKPVSLPMIFLGVGIVAGALPLLPETISIQHHIGFVEHFTEVVVIVSLMGAGLSLDRRVGWRRWQNTWRLLAIAMPLTIACVAVLGAGMLGFTAGAAVLLAAVLAPTDPVLASEVQVGEPATESVDEDVAEEEIRFSLTSEGGLNDALAFPFVYLALTLAAVANNGSVVRWFTVDVVYRLSAGVAAGLLTGWLLSKLFFSENRRGLRLADHREGLIALAATFLTYGLTELIQGYGFLAVFVAAVTIRGSERFHGYHLVLHRFTEQVERLLMVLALLMLGVAVADGLLGALQVRDLAFIALVLLVIRPLVAMLSLVRGSGAKTQRAAISFFGLRGIGSLYYVAYGISAATIAEQERVLALVGAVVVASVLLHGATAGPIMGRLDERQAAKRKRNGHAQEARS